jgi:valyl-tRNA synthetase
MKRVEGYRNFCNKLWNASRYVLGNCEGQDVGLNHDATSFPWWPTWIISRLQRAEQAIIDALDNYRFDLATQALYEFVWNEYCDWYLELTKPVLTGDYASEDAKRGTRRTLVRVLETILRLAAPDHALHHRRNLAESESAGRQNRPQPDDGNISLA